MGVNPRKILLAGASGLVGGSVLRQLLADPGFTGTVIAPMRRDPGLSDPRLKAIVTDFAASQGEDNLAARMDALSPGGIDAYVSCLGTTIKTAGSREAFIAVDRELVLRLAQLAFDRGARHVILVSSVGASRQSGNFYLRVKGEVEDALEKIGFDRVDIIQPGLLLGNRQEHRPGEAVARLLAPLGNRLLIGKFRSYRAIHADAVAGAIVALLAQDQPGVFSHTHDAIESLAG